MNIQLEFEYSWNMYLLLDEPGFNMHVEIYIHKQINLMQFFKRQQIRMWEDLCENNNKCNIAENEQTWGPSITWLKKLLEKLLIKLRIVNKFRITFHNVPLSYSKGDEISPGSVVRIISSKCINKSMLISMLVWQINNQGYDKNGKFISVEEMSFN